MVVLAALLGVGVHLLRSIWGLVADDEDGWTYLPLRSGVGSAPPAARRGGVVHRDRGGADPDRGRHPRAAA